MSSVYVRDEIEQFIEDNLLSENLIDMTAEYDDLEKLLADFGLEYDDKWLGIQYIGSDELPVSLFANNTNGKYRETGSIFLHVVEPARSNAKTAILTRCEEIRNLFRGRRINSIVVEGVTPPNFESSATLQFEGGFTSASIIVNYYYDRSL